MRFIYGSIVEWLGYNARIVKLHLVARDHSPEHKRRLRRALVAQLKHFPHLLTRRRQLQKRKPFPRWIRFHRWDYHRLRTDAGTGPEP
jgi:tRNA U34 5-methylaminomethyl-2-thiouridine-forming methyltransferase MnmC